MIIGTLLGFLALSLGAGLGAWHLLDQTPSAGEAVSSASSFDAAQLLVLADADMAATAYADGKLYPTDSSDQLIITSGLATDERVSLPRGTYDLYVLD